MSFDGLNINLGNLARLSDAKSRSVSQENQNGAKGKGGMALPYEGHAADVLGQGWKCAPCFDVHAGTTYTIAEIDGPGAITHMWFTLYPDYWRSMILRIYWNGEETPSVETPIGDFFCNGWNRRADVNSLPIAVNPAGGFNTYFQMPFKKKAKITIENIGVKNTVIFYQVDYTLTEIPDDMAYFHAQFRRSNPVKKDDIHIILDGVKGKGHYVGTYMAIQPNSNGWWGEGEVKFYIDGDNEFPTICGTGTEDYFGGAWNWDPTGGKEYVTYSTAFLGMHQVVKPTNIYDARQRFGMYRWHINDTIRFDKDLKVTIQDLGWGNDGRYRTLQDDISTVAYWYQAEPHAKFPVLPDRYGLEII